MLLLIGYYPMIGTLLYQSFIRLNILYKNGVRDDKFQC